jgi:3-oxoacyl-[acyl-carrier-protein] synthase-3
MRIITGIQQYLKAAPEQFPTTVQKYGNTSSASVAILLDELVKENKIQHGDLLVFSGFGAGFTTGSCILRY